MQLIVLGMHQSGMSMVARLLNMMGIYFGTEDSAVLPRLSNPKGLWERNDVSSLNKRLLSQNGASWRNVLPFQWNDISSESLKEFQFHATQILSRLETQRPWFIKDPVLSLSLPLWQPLFELPIYILVIRNPSEIAHSLEKRHGLPIAAGLALWHRYLADALNFTHLGKRIFVSHEELIANPVKAGRHLANQLEAFGVPLKRFPSDPEVEAFINPVLDLEKRKQEIPNLEPLLSEAQLTLWHALKSLDPTSPSSIIDISECNKALNTFTPLETAHAELVKLELLEQENLYLNERLQEETRKSKSLYAELKKLQQSTSQSDKAQNFDNHLELASSNKDDTSGDNTLAQANSIIHKQNDDKNSFLLVHKLKKLEEEFQGRNLQQLDKITQAQDILNTLASNLVPSSKNKSDQYYDDEYEIHKLRDRLCRREKTIEKLISWADALQTIIPINSSARKAQRYYKHWRSRYKGSTTLPLNTSLSALKQDAERRCVKNREKNNRIKIAENDLRNLLNDLECEDVFAILDFSGIYALTGIDVSHLASKSDAPNNLRLRDFSNGKEVVVSVVIPVHNQVSYTFGCLRSLSKVREATSFEVIIVDDCSIVENYQRIKSIVGVQVVRNEENLGFIGSCNKGAALAKGKYTLFLNNDTKVLSGWLDSLIQTFVDCPEAGLVGSKLLYPDHTLQEAGCIVWKDGSCTNYGRNDDSDKAIYNFLRETDYCSGACIILPSDLLREVGYFDEYLAPAYYEDVDLAFKIRAAGYRVYYQPASSIIHYEGRSNGTDVKDGLKQYQLTNKEKFVQKWHGVLDKEYFTKNADTFLAREGSRRRPMIVIIDHYVPKPDHDAGSRSTFQYVRLFLDLGLKVKFIPNNFHPSQPYTHNLEILGIEVLYSPWYQANIHTWLIEHGADIQFIFANRSHITAQYLDTFAQMPETKILYYGHDIGSLRFHRKFIYTGNQEDLQHALAEEKLEHTIWQKVDAIYYPSSEETQIVKSHFPNANARTLPLNILTPKNISYETNLENRSDLIFVGGFVHAPNEDAVIWFLDHCWPIIETALPQVKFRIVGSNPTTTIEKRASDRVIVTGWINDNKLTSTYLQARIAVIPLRYGAGVKGKVVEAMHNHLPVVMTTTAAEGLPGVENFCVVKDDPLLLAASIIEIFNDQERLVSMAEAGKNYVIQNFSSEAARSVILQDLNISRVS